MIRNSTRRKMSLASIRTVGRKGRRLALAILTLVLAGHEARGQVDLNGNVTRTGSSGANSININVDAFSGGASSSFEFGIPPGRSGLEPDLSLTYSSGSTAPSSVGTGWDLGLAFIQRDTRNGQPSWTSNDTFLLRWNGRTLQLWMSSDQTVNGVGTREFRTKIQTFMRIKSYSFSGGVPTYWEVWDGSGRKYQFGGTTHTSTTNAQANDFLWALNSVTDQYGNYMDIDYLIDTGTLYPKQILYTGNINGLAPKNKVEFLYESRYDVTTSRLGKTSEMRYRLRSVRTWAGTTTVANYLLDYTTPTSGVHPIDFCASCPTSTTTVCPNGNLSTCANTCEPNNGFCAVCTPVCTLCTGVVCQGTTSRTCRDGSTSTCTNTCDSATGQCGCTPTCRICTDCGTAPAAGSSTFSVQDAPSLLSRITQYDGSGSASLPATTFTYEQDSSLDKGWSQAGGLVPEPFEKMSCTGAGTTNEKRSIRDLGIQIEDINRDGRPDLLKGYYSTCLPANDPANKLKVYTNPPNLAGGWQESSTWVLPEPFVVYWCNAQDYDNGARLVDINGDGLVDVVRSVRTSTTGTPAVKVYLNSGTGWVLQANGAFTVPVAFAQLDTTHHRSMDLGVRFADINGDGKVDIVRSMQLFSGNPKLCGLGQAKDEKGIYLNNGRGWTLQTGWAVPEPLALEYCDLFSSLPLVSDAGTRLLDVNGDGLVDMFRSATVNGTFIQTLRLGKGYNDPTTGVWETVTDWALPAEDFNAIKSASVSGKDDVDDRGVRFADVNADGMIDMVVGRQWDGVTTQKVYLHKAGKGWAYDPDWVMHDVFVTHLPAPNDEFDEGVRLVDLYARGRAFFVRSVDTVNCTGSSARQVRASPDASFQNLLIGSTNGLGGSTSLVYMGSTSVDNTGGDGIPDLGFLLPIVQSITQHAGLPSDVPSWNDYSFTYSHTGGLFNYNSREFRGFRYIRSNDPAGAKHTETLFVQDPGYDVAPLAGAIERTAVRRYSDAAVFSVIQNSYVHASRTGNPPFFDRLSSSEGYLLDFTQAGVPINALSLSSPVKHTRTNYSYTFATSGEPFITSRQVEALGDVSTPNDDLYATDELINDSTLWRIGLLKHRKLTLSAAGSGPPLTDGWLTYDTLAYGSVSRGDVTSVEQWPGGTTADLQGSTDNIRTTLRYDDGYGHVNAATDPSGHTQYTIYGGPEDPTFTYPTQEKVTTTDGARSVDHVTVLQFDPRFGAITKVDNLDHLPVTYEYDSFGRTTKIYNALDSPAYPTQCFQYRLTSVPVMYASFTREVAGTGDACGPNGMLASVTFFDGLGRQLETKTETVEPGYSSTVTSAIGFNAQGRVKYVWKPFFSMDDLFTYTPQSLLRSQATLLYDAVGRKTIVRLPPPSGSTTFRDWTTTYSGWTTTVKDPANRQQQSDLDASGRVLQTRYIDPATSGVYATTTFNYDHLGQPSSIGDNVGHTTSFHFDVLGRLTSTDEPGGTITRSYNPDGTLLSTKKLQGGGTPVDGFGATYTYDEMHRVLSTTYLDQTGPVFHYDEYLGTPFTNARAFASVGHLTSVADSSTGVRQELYYDVIGRPIGTREQIPQIASSGGLWYATSWTLDALGRTNSLTYPDPARSTISYAYGVDGHMTAINSSLTQSYASNIHYSPTGMLTSLVYGNGLTVSFGREDATDWLTHIGACFNCTGSSPITVADATYTQTLDGAIQSIVDKNGAGVVSKTRMFTLDMLNRLTNSKVQEGTSPSIDLPYGYDTVGNLTSKEALTFSFGGPDPHQVTSTSSGLTLAYGASGEIRSILNAQLKGRTFGYTGAGRINHILDTQAGTEAFFLYDPSGSRVRRQESSSSGSTETIFPAGGYEESAGAYKRYITLGGVPIAEVDGTFSQGDQQTYYFVGNELDGTSVVTDQTQTVVQRIDYKPYGEIDKITAGNFTPAYMFAGVRRDGGTGLYDFGARFYDPSLGRFLTTDPVRNNPLDLTNLNPYAYASGNPASLVDIGGLSTGDTSGNCPGGDLCLDFYTHGSGGGPPGGNPGDDMLPDDTRIDLGGVLDGVKDFIRDVGHYFGFGGGHPHLPGLGRGTDANTQFSVGQSARAIASGIGASQAETSSASHLFIVEQPGDPSRTPDLASPWQVGREWLTGSLPKTHNFGPGDPFTELLRQHWHIQDTREQILISGAHFGSDSNPYRLDGLQGIPKYFGDYSTILTDGTTGNLAVTYLGGYDLSYEVVPLGESTALVEFQVRNASTLGSLLHAPYFGYLPWWGTHITPWANRQVPRGPMSRTEQTFNWGEVIGNE